MKRFRLSSRPQKRFYLVLGLVIFTLFTGAATGFGLFYRLVYVLALTSFVGYVWTWYSLRSLDVEVRRRTRQAQVGEDVEEEVTVRNRSKLPRLALEVTELTDLPGSHPGTAVGLRGNESKTWMFRTAARKRGAYNLGPIKVSNTDPFGLFSRERVFGETSEVLIFPRIFNLSTFEVPAADLSGDSSVRKRTHNVTPHASSIREYASGDSLSRVHWNSTARHGKLMSKVFDLGRAAEVWVLIDLHRDIQAGELEESTDEYAVSIGASLAKRYLEAELPVGLSAYGDERYFLMAETGAGQLQRIMEFLAMSKSEGNTPIGDALIRDEPLWGHQSSLIVVTASPHEDWVLALGQLAKRGVRVVVALVDGSSFGGFLDTREVLEPLYLAGIPTYLVRQGDDLPAALSRRYTGNGVAAAAEVSEETVKV